jgi:hypothetical protein
VISREQLFLRVEHERRLFRRLVISWFDLVEARGALTELFGRDDVLTNQVLRESLLTSIVVSYGRCFTPSRGPSGAVQSLPQSFLRTLDSRQLAVHHRVLQLRNTEFAHSDESAAEVEVRAFPDFSSGVLLPSSRKLRSSTLSDSDLRTVSGLLDKLHIFIYDEIVRLSPLLAPHGDF